MIAIADLSDIELERNILKSLMMFDVLEFDDSVSRLRVDWFYNLANQELLEIMKNLNERGFLASEKNITTELKSRNIDTKIVADVLGSDGYVSIDHAIPTLEEWYKKRVLHNVATSIFERLGKQDSSTSIASSSAEQCDDLALSSSDGFKSYCEIKEELVSHPEVGKIETGVGFIDKKLKGGIEHGQFILLMGDPESGKTSLATQIAKYVSNTAPVMFMPFEFTAKSFIEHNVINEPKFNTNSFFMESDNDDIHDIAQRIKKFARETGGRLVVIDSQMMVQNVFNKGTSQERETEKFIILQKLCIKHGLAIIFICQQGKEDTKGGSIIPMGTKNGGHAAHQIWYVKKPKSEFDKDGNDIKMGIRDFLMAKNKQTGIHYSKPIRLDTRTLEFEGRAYDETDKRSAKYGKPSYETSYEMDHNI